MITCSECGNLFVECETKAKGLNLHTKIEDKGIVIVTPEFYQIADEGKDPSLACVCGKLQISLACDYCGIVIKGSTVSIVKDRHGKKLVGCKICATDRPPSSKITKIETESLKFITKS